VHVDKTWQATEIEITEKNFKHYIAFNHQGKDSKLLKAFRCLVY